MDTNFSIIIPVYNTKIFYLKRCIDSIIKTKYKNIEILIINDGSKKEYEKDYSNLFTSDNRIQIFNRKHRGVSAARNFGIKHSNYDYLCFVDGDDEVNESIFNDANKIIKNNDVDMVFGSIEFHPNIKNIKIQGPQKTQIYQGVETRNVLISLMNVRDVGFENQILGSQCGKIIKSKICKKILFNEKVSICEDQLFVYEIIKEAKTIVLSPNYWYKYYQNNDSTIHLVQSPLSYYSYFYELYKLNLLENNIELKNNNYNKIVGFYSDLLKEEITKKTKIDETSYDISFIRQSIEKLDLSDSNLSLFHRIRGLTFKSNNIWLYKLYLRIFKNKPFKV